MAGISQYTAYTLDRMAILLYSRSYEYEVIKMIVFHSTTAQHEHNFLAISSVGHSLTHVLKFSTHYY